MKSGRFIHAHAQHEHNGDNTGNCIGIEKKQGAVARESTEEYRGAPQQRQRTRLNPQNVSISAKKRKMNKENTKVRKRKAKENQQKRKLTTRKPANNRKLERNRGKTAIPGPTQRRTSPTNSRYTRPAGNAGKRQEHSGKAEEKKSR